MIQLLIKIIQSTPITASKKKKLSNFDYDKNQ